MPRPSLRDQGMYGLMVVLAPLALSLLVTVGLRYLFALPDVAPRQLDLPDHRSRGQRRMAAGRGAVRRRAAGSRRCSSPALPAAIAILGWMRARAAILLGFFCALLWFEALFRDWRKLPFTCSYLPGQAAGLAHAGALSLSRARCWGRSAS